MYNRLHTIPACDGQTDIFPGHSPRYTYASRGKNASNPFTDDMIHYDDSSTALSSFLRRGL